jgi:hypothetical protein
MAAVDTKRSVHAITDLYNEERRTVLVRYPPGLLVALGLAGVLAFALTGFFGYKGDPPLLLKAFSQAWALFLWFCALIIVLQVSIFRHPTLRRQRNATLIATGVSMVLVAIFYVYRDAFIPKIEDFIYRVLHQHILLSLLGHSPWTYLILNFGIIAIYVADTAVRWNRRSRGLPPNPRADIGFGKVVDPDDLPAMEELISGDLVAGAVLLGLLAVFFRPDVVGALVPPDPTNPFTICTVSLPGACAAPPVTLTFIDSILALLSLPAGLFVLALSAILNGLAVVGGVNPQGLSKPVVRLEESSTRSVSEEVTLTLLEALRAALDRGLRYILLNLLASLRVIGWPLLVFLGVFGVANVSRDIKLYLHTSKYASESLGYEMGAMIWGLVAVLAIVFAAALMLYQLRVATNSLKFAALVGFAVLLTVWIFALALFFFEQLLVFVASSNTPQAALCTPQGYYCSTNLRWHPFDLGITTAVSLGAFLIFAAIWFFGRMRNSRANVTPVS